MMVMKNRKKIQKKFYVHITNRGSVKKGKNANIHMICLQNRKMKILISIQINELNYLPVNIKLMKMKQMQIGTLIN